MAIVQISRITQRQGLEQDLPQPLAGAEFGWAVDQRRLFIGNGTLADGAPVVGNTEVLTEFSDILSFGTTYTYKGDAAGYTVQTGPTAGDPVSQSLQDWFDQWASVKDFGATGDGITDDTAAINRALDQLYCQQSNTQVRRSLFFPAGTYIVTDTIKIPAYAKLYGEGAESSIISFDVQAWTSTIPYTEGILVKNGVNYFRSLVPVPIGATLPTPPASNTYWAPETLPGYIARTADSKQQIGANITNAGATPPKNIEVSDMAFITNQLHDGVLVQDATETLFTAVNIAGPLTTSTISVNLATDDKAAVRWASTASLICTQVVFDKCKFSGFTYGTSTEQPVKGVTISNSYFDTLYQGAVLGGVSPVLGGPTGFRLLHNVFDNVYNEGIKIQGVSLNATGYNVFYDVGNHFNGVTLPSTSIIDIDAENNLSVGDMFQRNTNQSLTYPRINLNNTASIGIDSAVRLQLGTYTRTTGVSETLNDGSVDATLFTISSASTKAFKMDYTIIRDTAVRTGTMTVVCNAEDSLGDFSYSDDYQENVTTDVTLTPSESALGGTITVAYTASATGADATIYYSLTNLA